MKKIFLFIVLSAMFCSCVDDNIYGPAVFGTIENTTAYTADDPVTVNAVINSLVGIESAALFYNVNGGEYQLINMVESGDNLFTAVIPAQSLDAVVNYYIAALSNDGSVVNSAVISYTVGSAPIDYTGLRLNELNGITKFMELYNGNSSSIYIKGIYIEKDGESVWTSTTDSLRSGAYLLLYSADVTGSGGAQEGYDSSLIFNSGLSAKKAVRVQLFSPAASSIDDFNLVDFQQAATDSYSRNNDLSWAYSTATPGAANDQSTDYVSGLAE